jgi:hypothetical protein
MIPVLSLSKRADCQRRPPRTIKPMGEKRSRGASVLAMDRLTQESRFG